MDLEDVREDDVLSSWGFDDLSEVESIYFESDGEILSD